MIASAASAAALALRPPAEFQPSSNRSLKKSPTLALFRDRCERGGRDMRGTDERAGVLLSDVDLEQRVPRAHPLQAIRAVVDEALAGLAPIFVRLYAPLGRPGVPPEQLLRALLLQAFYSIRSERQLMERLEFDLLFRWFVGRGDRRSRVGSLDLLQEPRPLARGRRRRPVPGRTLGPAAGQASPVEPALQRRRHADPGLGQHEELPAKGRRWRAAEPRTEPRVCASTASAGARDARFDHRPRRAALPPGAGDGSAALLPRPRADGEPPQPARSMPS